MRPPKRTETGQQDLLRSRLDQIVSLKHPLVKLARAIDWGFLESRFGAAYSDKPGRPPLPTRLMAGLAILKHMENLSDETLCARWLENPYYQLFCGEEFFRQEAPFDRSSLTRWRQRMGEEKLLALVQECLHLATRSGADKPADFTKMIVDTTVQPKAITFPTDAKLVHRAREKLVGMAKTLGVTLRQSYVRVGKAALIAHQRYAHAKQFKRANRALKKQRTYSTQKAALARLSMHHHRQSRMLQDVPRHAAENLLSQTRVSICAHGQQVAVELLGRGQQTGADNVVDWFEHPQISRHAMHRQVGLKFVRLRATPLVLFSPENAYGFCTLQPRHRRLHGSRRLSRAVPPQANPPADRRRRHPGGNQEGAPGIKQHGM